MRTYNSIKGLKVFSGAGVCIGKAHDIIVDQTGKIQGILIKHNHLLSGKRLLPFKSIQSIGKDGIITKNDDTDDIPKSRKDYYSLEHQNSILGKPLMTVEGNKLGLVQDVYFGEELGMIEGIEVTDGWFADISEGRKVVKTKRPPEIGEDVLIVQIDY